MALKDIETAEYLFIYILCLVLWLSEWVGPNMVFNNFPAAIIISHNQVQQAPSFNTAFYTRGFKVHLYSIQSTCYKVRTLPTTYIVWSNGKHKP